MDATVKQMLDGFKMGIDAQAATGIDASLLDAVRAVIARMEEIAAAPGVDLIKFQEKLAAEDLMTKYAAAVAKLSEAQIAAMARAVTATEDRAAAAKPVDLKTLDLTDVEVAVAPHRRVYEATVKDDARVPRQHAAYEALFALAAECKTIPEFNRRAQAGGHFDHLGLAATWDVNLDTLRLEIEHRQPDMVTYALDALAATRDHPFPLSIAYTLTRLALFNERKQAVRWSYAAPVVIFTGELTAYLVVNHTEDQRRKVVNLYALMREFTGLDIDAAFAHPYIRQLLTLDDARHRAEQGPDYLGVCPFMRAGFFVDAVLEPAEKKAYAERKESPPGPPASPYPCRTGAVGGVDITLAEPPFAAPTDGPYPVRLTLTNGAAETRRLDAAKGLGMWIFNEEGVAPRKQVAAVPAELEPGASFDVPGDLYAWGLPKEERLFMVAFDVGVQGYFGADLAAKYADPAKVTPMFIPNYYLMPFAGGVATDPAFVMPHRPVPPYPFASAAEGKAKGEGRK